MRFVTGGIFNETNTFNRHGIGIGQFVQYRDEACLALAGANHSLGGVIDGCRDLGIELVPTLYADALATGLPTRVAFEALLDELCDRIGAALPADGIVLTLHGAMVAEGYPDAEAEVVRRVRQVAGPGTPIAVTVDFHANLGQEMIDAVDIVTTYDTYPHVDQNDRGREAVDLLARVAGGEIRPAMALVKPPMMPVPQGQHTEAEPFRTIMRRAHEMEQHGALTVSVAGGFAYADTPAAGSGFLVTTDGDPELARQMANELATLAWSMRDQMVVRNTPPDVAVAEAIAYPAGPVVLVDVGDNIGGGTPGDGTILLAELLRQEAKDAVMVIADREAVAAAFAAGVGGRVRVDVGGKSDDLHGPPVAIDGVVRTLADGHWVHEGPEWAGVPVESGPTAVVRVDGVTLVLTSRATAPGDLQQLKSVGIDPLRQHILVVKAAVRWRSGYGPIAAHAIHVDTPGLGSADLSRFDYQHIRRPVWPLDSVVWEVR